MNIVESFFQNVKDKLTSPFFGTLCFILIIHHWEFWFTLFNFDEDCTRTERLATLRLIGAGEFTWKNLASDLIWAVAITIIGYVVVFGTRTLSLFFDHKAMPWITNKVVDKNVVLKSVYQDVEKERNEYSEKYEEQRKLVRILSRDFDQQSEQIKDKDKLILSEGEKVNTLNSSNAQLTHDLNIEKRTSETYKNNGIDKDTKLSHMQDEFDKSTAYIGTLEKELFSFRHLFLGHENKQSWTSIDRFPKEVVNKVLELKSSDNWKKYTSLYYSLTNGGTYGEDELSLFRKMGLITKDNEPKITAVGKIIGFHKDVFTDNDVNNINSFK